MTEALRHPKAIRRYNRGCGEVINYNELQELPNLRICCRMRRPQPTILPLKIVLAEKQEEYKEQIETIFNQRKIDQFRKYLKLLSLPDQMTSQWRNYGRKHIDEISVLAKNFYFSHSM